MDNYLSTRADWLQFRGTVALRWGSSLGEKNKFVILEQEGGNFEL